MSAESQPTDPESKNEESFSYYDSLPDATPEQLNWLPGSNIFVKKFPEETPIEGQDWSLDREQEKDSKE